MIQLVRITLTNFKKHEHLEIDLSSGLNVIRGSNWAGKSSVLHGILFALGWLSAVPGPKARLKRRGGGQMAVSLVIKAPDALYEIKRTAGTATISPLGQPPIVSSSSEVATWTAELFGADHKLLQQLCHSPQTQTAALLSLGVPALNRLVEELSGADQVEKYIERASARLKTAETQLEGVPEISDEELEQQRLFGLESKQLVTNVTWEVGEAQKREAEAAAMLDTAQTKLADLRTANAIAAQELRMQAEWQRAKDRAAALAKVELPAVQPLPADVTPQLKQLQASIENEGKLQIRRQALAEWFNTTGKAWQEGEALVPKLEEARKLQDERGKHTLAQHNVCADLKANHEALLAKTEALAASINGATCRTCGQPIKQVDLAGLRRELEEASGLALKAKKELMAKEVEVRELRAKMTQLGAEVRRLERLVPPDGYEQIYEGKLAELDSLPAPADLDAMVAERDNLTALQRIRQSMEMANARVEAEIQSHQTKLREAQEEVTRLAEYETVKHVVVDVAPVMEELDHAKLQYQTAREAVATWAGQISEAKSRLQQSQQLWETSQAQIAKRADLAKRAARWAGFVKFLRGSKNTLLSNLWGSITAVVSEFLLGVTEGHATELVRTEDGQFAIMEEGELSYLEGGASGGMAAIAGTGLKLALAQLLPTAPGFLLLDEPSSELNDHYAGNLAAALAKQDRQMVVVTHRTGEEYSAETLVTLES